MKRLICCALAMLMLCAVSLGEGKPGSVYAGIEMNDTIETLTEKFGEGISEGEYMLFGDVLCAFFESGRLQAKSVYYSDIRLVAADAQADFSRVREFKYGREQIELESILGEGAEIIMMNLSDEEDAGLRKLLCWKSESGAVLEALFELDDGKWILFALGELK